MGATEIAIRGEGTSMKRAFERLQHESNEQDGNDAYSGGFNTIIDYYDLTAAWRSSGIADAAAFLEQDELLEQVDKREANAVCLRAPTDQREGEYLFVGWAAE